MSGPGMEPRPALPRAVALRYDGARGTPTYDEGMVYHFAERGRLGFDRGLVIRLEGLLEVRHQGQVAGCLAGDADDVHIAFDRLACRLLLEQVPQLTRSNFNEARRFVTLIDALYEAKVEELLAIEEKLEEIEAQKG